MMDKAPDPGRRRFMGLVGGAASVAALPGCVRKPVEHILPYAKRPEDLIPGRPLYFATSTSVGEHVYGLLVESQDGRPTKIEGNPKHPMSRGATPAVAQGIVYELYDDDRGKVPWFEGKESSWEAFQAAATATAEQWTTSGGEGVAVLTRYTPSPTLMRVLGELEKRCPKASFYSHDVTHSGNAATGAAMAGAGRLAPDYHLSKARVIVALDADLFGNDGDSVKHALDFADGRRQPSEGMNRLYAVEPVFTLTGGMADHRLRLKSRQVGSFLAHLAQHVGVPVSISAKLDGKAARIAAAVAADLTANKGASVVAVGSRQPAHVHGLAALVNQTIGAVGATVDYRPEAGPGDLADAAQLGEEIRAGRVSTLLVLGGNPAYDAPADVDLDGLLGQVPTSIVLGYRRNDTAQNATWYLPQSHVLEAWGDLAATDGTASIQQPLIAPLYPSLSAIELVAKLSGAEDPAGYAQVRATWAAMGRGAVAELNAKADAAEKRADDLEKAVEAARAKLEAAQQKAPAPQPQAPPQPDTPAVDPVAMAAAAVIAHARAAWESARERANAARSAADVANAEADRGATAATTRFEADWRKWVHDGVVSVRRTAPSVPSFVTGGIVEAFAANDSAQGLELNFLLGSSVVDGRFANNPWMQELPDPLTKIVWDNAAYLSPATAKELGVKSGDLIHVKHGGHRVETPAWIAPGTADGVVALTLGYGAKHGGRTASAVGANAYPMRTTTVPWFGDGAVVSTTHQKYPVATVQDYDSLATPAASMPTRTHIRQASLAELRKDPDFVRNVEIFEKGAPENGTLLWTEPALTATQQWGMGIDLNVCTGCGACTIACNAENNIPVVGKEDCLNGREMHWMRVDRYFGGEDPDDPQALIQPIGCAQCETAPCENVCPVAATTHSPSGLNDMAYNRCIGTRYCSNNCPFKVRRFNYYNYTKRNEQAYGSLLTMQRNPDVTVRFRGVIEKCSYCVQRINAAVIHAKTHDNGIVPDGGVVAACQQACPTRAITFGDIRDPNSAVSATLSDSRNYELLEEMNIRSRSTFLARIRNTNPVLG